MSTYWLLNMTGVGLSEAQLEIVPYPLVELTVHITCKTIQAGTLLGSVIGSAIGLAKRKEIKAALIKGGKYGILVGLVVGPMMTVMAMRGKSAPEIIDRCFRLRHNFGQLWVDRSFFLAAAIGLASAGPAGVVAGINGAVIVSPLGRAVWEGITSGFGKKL